MEGGADSFSRADLDDMLSTLQVNSRSRLVVDRNRFVPLKLEEKTVLQLQNFMMENTYRVQKDTNDLSMLGKRNARILATR